MADHRDEAADVESGEEDFPNGQRVPDSQGRDRDPTGRALTEPEPVRAPPEVQSAARPKTASSSGLGRADATVLFSFARWQHQVKATLTTVGIENDPNVIDCFYTYI